MFRIIIADAMLMQIPGAPEAHEATMLQAENSAPANDLLAWTSDPGRTDTSYHVCAALMNPCKSKRYDLHCRSHNGGWHDRSGDR